MILKYALAVAILLSFVIAFVSVCGVLYNGAKLIGTYNDSSTPRSKKLGMLLFPLLTVTPWAQPPEKKKYADRLAFSLLCALLFWGLHEALKLYLDSLT